MKSTSDYIRLLKQFKETKAAVMVFRKLDCLVLLLVEISKNGAMWMYVLKVKLWDFLN